jgi:hypothetical protein
MDLRPKWNSVRARMKGVNSLLMLWVIIHDGHP